MERFVGNCRVCGCGKESSETQASVALNKYITENIVLARAMGVQVRCVGEDDSHVVLIAPLAANSNDKGTGFAGSISSLAMLACWACAARAAERLCRQESTGVVAEHTVVARDASVHFKRPVQHDFMAVAHPLTKEGFAAAADEYARRGRAHLTITAEVYDSSDADAAPCLTCEGVYVVLTPSDAGATRAPPATSVTGF